MESMMKLPDDMFKLELLPYLTVNDIVKLDNAFMNHKDRPQLLEKISGLILTGDKYDTYMKASLFRWLGMRRIYLIKIFFDFKDDNSTPSSIENDYVDQFRYTQHVIMRGSIRDDMAIFIISKCTCLLSIDISRDYKDHIQITDHTLQSIAEHCSGLQSLSLNNFGEITDAGLIAISEHCPNLQSLEIISSSITDASIISISTYCTGLQTLCLQGCCEITDASIVSISTHCTGLLSLNIVKLHCRKITDVSIISISTHCTGLQSLNLEGFKNITDVSIIPISENCTGLKNLYLSYTKITEASLIAIAKNCTGLQSLDSYGCDEVSSEELRDYFDSVSNLRAVILSIYPSLPI